MSWRSRDRGDRPARPRLARLPREVLERLRDQTVAFVDGAVVLRELVDEIQLARGRLYLWREPGDLMARVTLLGPRSMLLEAPRGESWTESRRGTLATVLSHLENDTEGTFHGLGCLAGGAAEGEPPAQVILHRQLGIPIRVLAEPRAWYEMHREPVIAEVSEGRDRALVRFAAFGQFGSFQGSCLYALRDGEWGCFTVRPAAAATIDTAEAWLVRRGWEDWI